MANTEAAAMSPIPVEDFQVLADFFRNRDKHNVRCYIESAANVIKWAASFLPEKDHEPQPMGSPLVKEMSNEQKCKFLEDCCNTQMVRGAFPWSMVLQIAYNILKEWLDNPGS